MKKRIVLLSIMLLLVSGCSIQTLSTTSFEDNISMILSDDTTLANVNFDGYHSLWNKKFSTEQMKKENLLVNSALIRKDAFNDVSGFKLEGKGLYED